MPDIDLDTRIRQLVASAVADAPAPPELDPVAVPVALPERDSRRWWLGGGVAGAVLAAAAIVAALVFVGRSDESVTTPATNPSTTTPPVTTAAPPDETTPDTAPVVVAPTTVAPPTTAPGAVAGGASIAVAGPGGVVIRDAALNPIRTLDEPMAIALPMSDGRVIVQRVSDPFDEGDHTPLIWGLDGSLTELAPDVSWAGPVTLHDVANVDDVPTLLYSVSTDIEDPEAAREQLYARTLDGPNAGATTLIGDIGGWESGTGRLHLSSNGLIVGEQTSGASRGPLIMLLPGASGEGTVSGLTPATMGLEESYADCETCPGAFTASPDGLTLAWIENASLVIWRVVGGDTPDPPPYPLARTPAGGDLDLLDDGRILVSQPRYLDAPPPQAVLTDPATGAILPLEEGLATHGPAIPRPQGVPGPPAPTTTVPDIPVPLQRVLVAGPDGVSEVFDGTTRVLTTEPMAIALAAGDGRIITQRQAGQPQGRPWTEADTVPLELQPDGTLLTLFGGADWDGATVLHDIELVNSRRLLLYSSQTEQVPQESNEDLWVADLDTGERQLVANGIGGWEFGTSRLHLGANGLIVGQRNSGPTWGPMFLGVPWPWASVELPTAADAGLEETYPDCECPQAFSTTSDGRQLLWWAGGAPVVLRTSFEAPGPPEQVVDVPDGLPVDLDVEFDAVLVNWFQPFGEPGQPAVMVPVDGTDPVTLPGLVATFPPIG